MRRRVVAASADDSGGCSERTSSVIRHYFDVSHDGGAVGRMQEELAGTCLLLDSSRRAAADAIKAGFDGSMMRFATGQGALAPVK